MPLIVQKFGGTSVADSQKILAAARKAIRAQQEGNQVVMVVSAMGHNTDMLVDLAKQITDEPPAREMDMLLSTGEQVSVALMAMAIHSLGHEAISLTGAQIGIKHRQHAHQGPHPVDLDRAHAAGCWTRARSSSRPAFRGSTRISTSRRSAAAAATRRPWRWRPCWRPTPAKSTPTSTASTRPIRGWCPRPATIEPRQLRRDARAGQPGRGRDAQPVDRVRQEVRRADPRAQQLQRRAGHDDRRPSPRRPTSRSAARRWRRTKPA